MNKSVGMPISLLLDVELRASSKFLWAVQRLVEESGEGSCNRDVSVERLSRHSKQSPKTFRRGLHQLEASGWIHLERDRGGGWRVRTLNPTTGHLVFIPADLVKEPGIGWNAKLLYACLQFLCHPRRTARLPHRKALADLVGVDRKTIWRAMRSLQRAGWLRIIKDQKPRRTTFQLKNPVSEKRRREAADLAMRVRRATYRGEALMKAFLSILIDSEEYTDNARPGWLRSPITDRQMEYDRWYYVAGVAFEFNGPQHYCTTEEYPSEQELREQQARDLMKLALSASHGVRLVVIRAEDLSIAAMKQKVRGLGLPLRDLSDQDHLIQVLENLSERYRESSEAIAYHTAGKPSAS